MYSYIVHGVSKPFSVADTSFDFKLRWKWKYKHDDDITRDALQVKVHACCCNWRHECYCTLQLRPHFTNISSHVSHLKTVTSCSWHVNIYLFVFFLGACVWRRHTGVWFTGRSYSTSCTHTTVLPGCECLTPFPCQTPLPIQVSTFPWRNSHGQLVAQIFN